MEAVLEAAVGVLVAAVQPGRAMTAVQDTEMDTILMLSEVVEETRNLAPRVWQRFSGRSSGGAI